MLKPQRDSRWWQDDPLEVPEVPYRTGPQALSAVCSAIVGILKRQEGLALLFPTLSITVLPGEGGYKPSWTALVEREKVRRLRDGLATKLVQDIAVWYVPDAPFFVVCDLIL